MTNWMDSAQAHHQHAEYERQRGQRESPEMPTTEEDALRAYKRARAPFPEFRDSKRLKALEELANARGWESLAEYKSRADARRAEAMNREAIRRRDADERASQLASRSDAIELHQRATKNGDKQLADAITRRAKTKGWNLMTKTLTDYTAELHTALEDIIQGHNSTARKWQDPLGNGQVTTAYVKEQLTSATDDRRAQLDGLLKDVNGYVADAQGEYDHAFRSLTTPSGDTNEQLLAEIRAGKEWDRIQRELSAIPKDQLVSEITARVSKAEPTTLKVLVDEAPSYLAGKGIPDPDDIVRTLVHSAHPELQEAQRRVTEATKLQHVIEYNARQVGEQLERVTDTADSTRSITAYVDPTSVKY